nr:RNA-directed DNA polymerase, eukaryota [Tanacetum cinerariifolium]
MEDDVARIAKSVFVTNFPDSFGPRDLWNLCQAYGKAVDVFLPYRKSKSGKRYAFFRFIRVDNIDRLIGNLCTLWVGRLHLHANVVRYERPRKTVPKSNGTPHPSQARDFSFANAVINVKPPNRFFVLDDPALVLDDSCGNDTDLSRHVFGKVKDFNSINTLKLILDKEGFDDINLSYLGGLWVMIELHNVEARTNFLLHSGVRSWFHELVAAYADFISTERIVWVDVEGVPMSAWVRAKELFTWSPSFSDFNKTDYSSDEEPQAGENTKPGMPLHGVEGLVDESDEEAVSETLFESGSSSQNDVGVNDQNEALINDGKAQDVIQKSDDPFEIYDILNKPPVSNAVPDPSLSHPPGYTSKHLNSETPVEYSCARDESPLLQKDASRADEAKDIGTNVSESVSEFSSNIPTRINSHGGSMLDMLDDIIKVRQSMGYVMEGCSKDFERIISLKGVDEGFI